MKGSLSVEAYIDKHAQWSKALARLRQIIRKAALEETIKWGGPVYTFDGKNVVGLGAFKSYVGLWFFQGAMLQDRRQKLVNAQEGTTRAMRQWRFNSVEEIEEAAPLISDYLQEAIDNQRHGRIIKPRRRKPLQISEELQARLAADPELREAFEGLTMGKQREYAEYILEAKRAETRSSRIEKIIPMIRAGVGLNDRYRR